MALPGLFRLSKSKDIKTVLQSPHLIEGRFFRLVFCKNYLPRARFAFLLSKKISRSAVRRNLLKRRSSEWIRKFFLKESSAADYVLFFKEGAARLDRKNFYKELEFIFSKTKI